VWANSLIIPPKTIQLFSAPLIITTFHARTVRGGVRCSTDGALILNS